jgi:ornithine decarboxylase
VRGKARRFRAAMPRVRPHYAVKANPDRRVLKVLARRAAASRSPRPRSSTCCSAWASRGRSLLLQPVKSRESIAYAAAKGVEWFVDRQPRRAAPRARDQADAKLYLRIAAPNIGSDWPLSGKFGAGTAEAREIVAAAAKRGADLAGVTFHVGSQCRNPENWRVALEKARSLFDVMTKAGLKPRLLNVGGGYPVRHVKPIPSIEMIAR